MGEFHIVSGSRHFEFRQKISLVLLLPRSIPKHCLSFSSDLDVLVQLLVHKSATDVCAWRLVPGCLRCPVRNLSAAKSAVVRGPDTARSCPLRALQLSRLAPAWCCVDLGCADTYECFDSLLDLKISTVKRIAFVANVYSPDFWYSNFNGGLSKKFTAYAAPPAVTRSISRSGILCFCLWLLFVRIKEIESEIRTDLHPAWDFYNNC